MSYVAIQTNTWPWLECHWQDVGEHRIKLGEMQAHPLYSLSNREIILNQHLILEARMLEGEEIIAIAVAAGTGGFILLVIIILCCIRQRRAAPKAQDPVRTQSGVSEARSRVASSRASPMPEGRLTHNPIFGQHLHVCSCWRTHLNLCHSQTHELILSCHLTPKTMQGRVFRTLPR